MNALRSIGRALLLALIRLVLRPAPSPPLPVERGRLRKVLVVRTDPRVGNVLLTTPLVRALRRGLPGARVDWLVAAGKQALVEGLADRVLPFEKRSFFRAPWRFWGFLGSLRRERYDAVIDAGHWHAFSFTSLFVTRFTGAPVRVGHARGESRRFLTHEVAKDGASDREVLAKLELLVPLGIAAAGEGLETTVDRGVVPPWLEEIGRFAALNPGARKADHRWAPEAFGRLAALLEGEGVVPLVLWGPGEEAIAQGVVAGSQGKARLAPPTDLAALAAVFRRSALVVTNDTGPMHLAVATGAPVVAVLLAEDGARWSHSGKFEGVELRGAPTLEAEVQLVLAAAQRLTATK